MSQKEVAAHADAIPKLTTELGLSWPRLRRHGAVVVHGEEAGYRSVVKLWAAASELVGTYVYHYHGRCASPARRTGVVASGELLSELPSTLDLTRSMLPHEKPTRDEQPLLRLTVEGLWISEGNVAEAYQLQPDLPMGLVH